MIPAIFLSHGRTYVYSKLPAAQELLSKQHAALDVRQLASIIAHRCAII